jgi:P27 family predicted phage terminase small subunit
LRGRKPKPTTLKLLEGYQRDRINFQSPNLEVSLPDPPEHLDPLALKEWHRIASILERMRVLTEADGAALAIYCESFSRWIRARADVQKRGMVLEQEHIRKDKKGAVAEQYTVVKLNPAIQVEHASKLIMLRVLTEFGLTPSSRCRIKGGAPERKDRLAEFLQKKKG